MNLPPLITKAIVSALRKIWWLQDANRKAVLKAAQEGNKYRCAKCGNLYLRKSVRVDHIIPIGSVDNWRHYIERLFCDASNLQILHIGCHVKKTNMERAK